jgi:adenine-specific DNA-methyltransferase
VVPAEIGHAPYAAPLLEYLVGHFSIVHIVAVRQKLFPDISEDCWLLYVSGFGSHTSTIRFTVTSRFEQSARPPRSFTVVAVREWRDVWNRRLRPFLISGTARDLYREVAETPASRRFGDLAEIGIGYVSGANDFFHLRQGEAVRWDIPDVFLHPSVRNARALPASKLTASDVERWRLNDDPMLLLRLSKAGDLPQGVKRYLDTDAGHAARTAYKCRVREPWYSVPDVQVPDFFLSYMSGWEPALVRNEAWCTCTNSVHSVRIRREISSRRYLAAWGTPIVQLSCEIEGQSTWRRHAKA